MKILNLKNDDIIKLFNEGLSSEKIAQKLGAKRSTIERRKRILGLKRSNSFYKKKLVDENFFHKIDTEKKAYWLGFLFADGNVQHRKTKTGNGSFIIKLAVQDKEICDNFLKDINANFETKTFLEKNTYDPKNKREVYHVEIFSKTMFDDLVFHGCVPKKSLILKFPTTIPKKLISHFIRGYFDGDGYNTISTAINKNKTNTIYYTCACGFNGTYEFLITLNDYLPIKLNIHKEQRNSNTNTYFASKSGGKNFKIIYDYLYKDATVYLNRKKSKFEKYFHLKKK